ncbi:MAG: glycosyltransferase [Rubrivivax sp.]|nr:MAG: glycosyltransferase [Rubrivivax sp.]
MTCKAFFLADGFFAAHGHPSFAPRIRRYRSCIKPATAAIELMMNPAKVLFVWDDKDISNAKLGAPEGGNIGIGGTDFLFGSIPHELGKRQAGKIAVLHQTPSNQLSPWVEDIVVPPGGTILATLKEVAGRFDLIVARPGDQLVQMMDVLPPSARVIAWSHNHSRGPMLKWLGLEPRIAAVVNVGREQMLLTRFSESYAKSTWIDNPVYAPPSGDEAVRTCRAVYMGALVPGKGFLHLAKLWPRIRQAVPQAELDVIGSADLYGAASKSDQQYLQKIHQHLGHDAAKSGVRFHGKLGSEKYAVLHKALVGLPNPTGFTETSCLSALEMSSCGLAIVAPQRWGFCDTVHPQHSGILAPDDETYVRSVVSLLSNPASTQKLGHSGKAWVAHHFSHEKISGEWQTLFQSLLTGRPLRQPEPTQPTGVYPHGFLYRHNVLGPYSQALRDVADKLVGWRLKQ